MPVCYWVCGTEVCQSRIYVLRPLFITSIFFTATVRVTVDGGTNQWISWLSVNATNIDKVKPPDIISGDMDSISKEILHYYIKTNDVTSVIHTPDQNETDFTKALHELRKYTASRDMVVIISSPL